MNGTQMRRPEGGRGRCEKHYGPNQKKNTTKITIHFPTSLGVSEGGGERSRSRESSERMNEQCQ